MVAKNIFEFGDVLLDILPKYEIVVQKSEVKEKQKILKVSKRLVKLIEKSKHSPRYSNGTIPIKQVKARSFVPINRVF